MSGPGPCRLQATSKNLKGKSIERWGILIVSFLFNCIAGAGRSFGRSQPESGGCNINVLTASIHEGIMEIKEEIFRIKIDRKGMDDLDYH
jgi:hypothetical protein